LHRGGANFLMVDGSVHFIHYSAAPLMPALATRSGREVVSLPD
jgi:prepilin-type processing-associated H-X9-DG protein